MGDQTDSQVGVHFSRAQIRTHGDARFSLFGQTPTSTPGYYLVSVFSLLLLLLLLLLQILHFLAVRAPPFLIFLLSF